MMGTVDVGVWLDADDAQSVGEVEKEDMDGKTEDQRAQKKARRSPLHAHYIAPFSFLLAAAGDSKSFKITETRFGDNLEAYVRPCYVELAKFIIRTRTECSVRNVKMQDFSKKPTLFVICGSSGIGKSTFLSYFVCLTTLVRKRFKNIALFHSSKACRVRGGTPVIDRVRCRVMLNKKTVIDGEYASVKNALMDYLPQLDLIIMDGCSMPCNFDDFKGTVIVAGSPSMYVKNLTDSMLDHFSVIMPALDLDEAREIANIIGVDHRVLNENWSHMEGITRYLFKMGAAKAKVIEAVKEVNTDSITKMVSMQVSDRIMNSVMVHSLVLWKKGETFIDEPKFELVSRFAEKLVAKKLCAEAAHKLKSARESMAPLSGAQGYAGALFEAYAIRKIQEGCNLSMRSLDDGSTVQVSVPIIEADPVVVENNDLTASIVPYSEVRVPAPASVDGPYLARLLWPSTTNFPTFDCFYFHTTGEVFPLQMTIATKHELKNSGASKAKEYFDKMLEQEKPDKYPAVFVVPTEMAAAYQKQSFTGSVNRQTVDLGPHFKQWVVGI